MSVGHWELIREDWGETSSAKNVNRGEEEGIKKEEMRESQER